MNGVPVPPALPPNRGQQQPRTPWSWAAGGRDDAGEQGGVVCGLQPAGLLHSACKRKSLLKVGEATEVSVVSNRNNFLQ